MKKIFFATVVTLSTLTGSVLANGVVNTRTDGVVNTLDGVVNTIIGVVNTIIGVVNT